MDARLRARLLDAAAPAPCRARGKAAGPAARPGGALPLRPDAHREPDDAQLDAAEPRQTAASSAASTPTSCCACGPPFPANRSWSSSSSSACGIPVASCAGRSRSWASTRPACRRHRRRAKGQRDEGAQGAAERLAAAPPGRALRTRERPTRRAGAGPGPVALAVTGDRMSLSASLRRSAVRAGRSVRRWRGPQPMGPGTPPEVPAGWSVGPPDFVGVGAQKAGTSWWAALIHEHPKVKRAGGVAKELHFFDRYWESGFGASDVALYASYFPRPSGALAGEWTPGYMIDFWTPELIARAAPRDARPGAAARSRGPLPQRPDAHRRRVTSGALPSRRGRAPSSAGSTASSSSASSMPFRASRSWSSSTRRAGRTRPESWHAPLPSSGCRPPRSMPGTSAGL